MMKPINKYPKTDFFRLTGTDVRRLVELDAQITRENCHLICVVPTEGKDDNSNYVTVRVQDEDGSLWDRCYERTPWGGWAVGEEKCICPAE